MTNDPNDLGNLSFTPEEAAAIAQAEATGAAQLLDQPNRWHWLYTTVIVALVVWLFTALIVTLVNNETGGRDQRRGASAGRPQTAPVMSVVAITRRAVHLRQDSSLTSQSLGVIAAGQPVIVRERRLDGFHFVEHGSQFGFVAAAYLVTAENVAMVPKASGNIGDISGLARLREQPQLNASVITALPAGAVVSVLGFTEDGWIFVAADRHAGFIWGGLIARCSVLPFEPTRDGADAVVVIGGRVVRPL